jgi:hypothetical protein
MNANPKKQNYIGTKLGLKVIKVHREIKACKEFKALQVLPANQVVCLGFI